MCKCMIKKLSLTIKNKNTMKIEFKVNGEVIISEMIFENYEEIYKNSTSKKYDLKAFEEYLSFVG